MRHFGHHVFRGMIFISGIHISIGRWNFAEKTYEVCPKNSPFWPLRPFRSTELRNGTMHEHHQKMRKLGVELEDAMGQGSETCLDSWKVEFLDWKPILHVVFFFGGGILWDESGFGWYAGLWESVIYNRFDCRSEKEVMCNDSPPIKAARLKLREVLSNIEKFQIFIDFP